MTQWEPVIGLEVHLQLNTQSKIFSGASTCYGAPPNTQACAVDLGLPGTLPTLNKKVLEFAVIFGLSIHADIARISVFDRKNYFYPDLPKGYQISQNTHPIVHDGHLEIENASGISKKIKITRAHLEEDAGKSIHEGSSKTSGIDLNRAGTPLLEIVSAPDLSSPSEAVAYLKALRRLIRYLGISEANMQEGSFRCDVNVSLRPAGTEHFGTRVEIKNINSFRFIERALKFEIDRQTETLNESGEIIQETRLYNPDRNETSSMRIKETAEDYRYFPDPDLLPIHLSDDFIASIQQRLPELPKDKRQRFETQYQLNTYDAKLLTDDIETANYFEKVLKTLPSLSPKLVANWLNGELAAALNKANLSITKSPITESTLAQLLMRISDHTLSGKTAKVVFEQLWNHQDEVDTIIEQKGLKQITDHAAIAKTIDEVIQKFPKQVSQYQQGQEKLFAFFVGQVMKATQGKANPQQVNQLLKEQLDKQSH